MGHSGKRAGVDAPAHRVHRWTGMGFWRRKAWVKHRPEWRTIATSSLNGGMAVQSCYGDAHCVATRTVLAPVTASAFASANL